jgi:hypothetical protein
MLIIKDLDRHICRHKPSPSPSQKSPVRQLAGLSWPCDGTSQSRTTRDKNGFAPRHSPPKWIGLASAWHRERETVAFAKERLAATCRPGAREPGKPPCHRVPAVSHEAPAAPSQTQAGARQHVQTARHVKPTASCAKDGRASPEKRKTRAPRTRRFPGTSRCTPCATPNTTQLGKISGGGWESFRCAPLWANRLCRAQTPIATQAKCQPWARNSISISLFRPNTI